MISYEQELVDLGDEGSEARTTFLFNHGPLRLPSLEEARRLLDQLDLDRVLELSWKLEVWSCRGLTFTLGRCDGKTPTAKVTLDDETPMAAYRELFSAYDGHIEPLRESLVSFVRRGCAAR